MAPSSSPSFLPWWQVMHCFITTGTMIEDAFKSTTLAEILAEPTTSKPLCPFPQRLTTV